ncbi:MAG: T9SS type A sorting domain-containing protein [Bacteroidales bacterium]|nr:T9SS type A sorting domain-containing protein [Bacteroidales bacterium]
MKKVNRFLLMIAITLTGSMAMAQIPTSILGEYVGALHVQSSLLGVDETFNGVTMELTTSSPNYAIKVAAVDLGGGVVLPEYEMDNVVITPQGNGYKLTRSGALNIIIDEIETPFGTMNNVPVAITLEDGYVENNVLTLSLEAEATVMYVIKIPISIDFEGALPPPPSCDPVTNAQAQIANCETATITWTAVTGATAYEVERDGNVLGTVTTTTYTENATFEHGQSYTWKIKTICDQNESPQESASATADCEPQPCNPVTNAKAQIVNCEIAAITWSAVTGAIEYEVSRDGNVLGTVTTTEFIETATFEHEQSYTWKIKTICDQDESPEESATTIADCEAPPPPCNSATSLKVEITQNPCAATLTWDAAPDMPDAKYNVYRNDEDNPIAINVEGTQYIDNDLEENVEYTWIVKTVCIEEEAPGTDAAAGMCEGQNIHEPVNSVVIYPNPSNTSVTIAANNFAKVEVFNTVGQLVETKTINVVDVSSYNTGVYLFKVYDANGNSVAKRVMVAR